MIAFLLAANLIINSDLSRDDIANEYRLEGREESDGGHVTFRPYTEELTWNKCLEFKLVKYGQTEQTSKAAKDKGKLIPFVSRTFFVGGDAQGLGVKCRPNQLYKFAFDARGTMRNVMVEARQWYADGKFKSLKTSLGLFNANKDWTHYEGTFSTLEGATRVALMFVIWGKDPSMPYKEGDTCQFDNFTLEEVLRKGEVDASVRVFDVPVGEGKPMIDLGELMNGMRGRADVTHHPVRVEVGADEKGLHFNCRMIGKKPRAEFSGKGAGEFWNDDNLEFFIAPGPKRSSYTQVCVSAGGGRWRAVGESYDDWSAKVKVVENGWGAKVDVSWPAVGYDAMPPAGTAIRFNVTSSHIVGPRAVGEPVDPRRATHMVGGAFFADYASVSDINGKPGDARSWSVMLLGGAKAHLDLTAASLKTDEAKAKVAAVSTGDAGACYVAAAKLKVFDRETLLSKKPFLITQVPISVKTTVPFKPLELDDPQSLFKVRAAVNELTGIALALENTQDRNEEFRVWLEHDFAIKFPCGMRCYPLEGLRRADVPALEKSGSCQNGKGFHSYPADAVVGPDKFTIRRGVKFRDSDGERHGAAIDPLVKLNEGGTVPLAAKEAGLVWIEFDTHGVKPGVYRGRLGVTSVVGGRYEKNDWSRGNCQFTPVDDSQYFDVELEVLPIELDDTAFGINTYGGGFVPHQLDFMNRYCVYQHNASPWYFETTYDKDGNRDRSVKPRYFLKEYVANVLRTVKKVPGVPRFYIGFDFYRVFRDNCWPKANGPKGTEKFWAAYRDWCRWVDSEMRGFGVAGDDYAIEVFDEPRQRYHDVEEVTRAFKETRAALPEVNITLTYLDSVFYDRISEYVTEWVVQGDAYLDAGLRKYIEDFRSRPGKSVCTYYCGINILDPGYAGYRLQPWVAAAAGGPSCRKFEMYRYYTAEPGVSLRQVYDRGVVYDNGSSSMPSTRLLNLVAGIMDIRYMRKLESLARGRSTPEAKEALEFLKVASDDTVLRARHDPTCADRMRTGMIDRILKLQGSH